MDRLRAWWFRDRDVCDMAEHLGSPWAEEEYEELGR